MGTGHRWTPAADPVSARGSAKIACKFGLSALHTVRTSQNGPLSSLNAGVSGIVQKGGACVAGPSGDGGPMGRALRGTPPAITAGQRVEVEVLRDRADTDL